MTHTMNHIRNYGELHDAFLGELAPSDTQLAIENVKHTVDAVGDVAGLVARKTLEVGLPVVAAVSLMGTPASAESMESRSPAAVAAPHTSETPPAISHANICAEGEVKAIYGTTASKIAKANGITLQQFAEANADRITNINDIYAGHCYRLTATDGLVRGDYVVKSGDTMSAIAKKIFEETGVKFLPSELAKDSGIRNANRIRPGMHVYYDWYKVGAKAADVPEAPFSPVPPAPVEPQAQTQPAPAVSVPEVPVENTPVTPEPTAPVAPAPVSQAQPAAEIQPSTDADVNNATIDKDWNVPVGPDKPFKTEQEAIDFQVKVVQIGQDLGFDPDYLMNAMGFETGSSYDPAKKNGAGSGATGLIQFMPDTAEHMGTTVEELAQMSPMEQLDFVKKYFESSAGQLHDMRDVYLKIFFPALIGQGPDAVLPSYAYRQNKGFDANHDGKITKDEITQRIVDRLHDAPRLPNPISDNP